MKNYYVLFLLALCFMAGCTDKGNRQAPVSLTWEMGANSVEEGHYSNAFIIKNISGKPLDDRWAVYYSQLPTTIKLPDNSPVKIDVVNGNFFRICPSANYQPLAAGDSLRIDFICQNSILKSSQAPEGVYFIADMQAKEQVPLAIKLRVVPFNNELQWSRPGVAEIPCPYGDYMYQQNSRFSNPVQLAVTDIFPSVRQVTDKPGKSVIGNTVRLSYEPEFENEAALLIEKLQNIYQVTVKDSAATVITLGYLPESFNTVNDEHYTLDIENNGITVRGNSAHAVFNGTQTLLGMLKNSTLPLEINNMSVSDYPDLLYRGMMLDIARNFTSKENLMKLIDRIASYKLNVLHFHCTDDEAWRIEIPGLEELIEVGSHRGHTLDEQTCLYPGYDGCFDPNDDTSTSNGHYTRADFIEVLKYAHARHVQVIPELEMPGHARAAIVSMKARYNKYKDSDKEKAVEYLLSDPADTSKYYSIQAYTDNVLNVAMPSTYRFIDKVLGELADMYKEAGVPFETVHMGGDEVPDGVWLGSPACQALMAENQISDIPGLSSYFLLQINDILKKHDLKLSGWQEIAAKHTPEVDKILAENIGGVYCWSSYELPYTVANKGYDVIICNVGNFYMDMSANKHPEEPGLYWGGFVDEYISFNMQPFDIYRSARINADGTPADLQKAGEGKTQLNTDGLHRIKGVQAQLFAETVRNFDMVEYYLFPKMFGLIERGWNARPAWTQVKDPKAAEQAYQKALELYNAKIGQGEMPRLHKEGVNFRVGQPGIIIKDGLLYANSPIAGAEIRYTTDGSEPTVTSALWDEPVVCDVRTVKARTFWQGHQSVTTIMK